MSERVNFVLPCPCGGDLTAVMDSRPTILNGMNVIRRRRVCDKCGKRSSTFEAVQSDLSALQRIELRKLRAAIDTLLLDWEGAS
jgi:transcriptional regulator NrdR family protein